MKKLGNKIYSIDLGIKWIENYEKICNKIIKKHNVSFLYYLTASACSTARGYTRSVDNEYATAFTDYLTKIIKELFNEIIIYHKSHLFAYVSNSKWAKYEWHNHLEKSPLGIPIYQNNDKHLSTVFYLKKPNCEDGKISIIDDDNNKIDYLPKQGEYIIFPMHYMHRPTTYTNEEYRIALNLNIFTTNTHSEFLY